MTLSIANSNTKKKQLCTVVLYTNSPLSITHNMYNSLKRISPPEQWPELQSPKLTWGEDFVVQSPSSPSLPSDRSAQDGAADPILVYQSQCCLNERPVNQCILDYMAYLVNNGKRELDMTACLYGDITVDDLVCLRDFVAADRYFRSFVLIGGCGVPSGAAGGANAASKSSVAASASAAPAEDVLALMGGAVAGNRRLTRLVLRGLDDEEGNAESFCTAFAGATGAGVSQVCMLDLSGNTLKDGGAKALSHAIRQMQHGLVSLRLAGCGIGSKGFQALFGALKARVDSSIYLRELDISYNKLDDNGTVALCEWVKAFRGGETGLRKLGLAQTKLSFKDLMVLPSELKYLDISGNQITPKEVDNFKMAVAHIPKICAEDFVCHEKAYGALIEMFLSRKKPNKMLNLGRREAKQSSDTTTAGVLVAALETVSPKYLRKLYLSGLAISRDLFERMVSFLVNAGEIETLDISYPHKDYVHGREREWAENIESLLFDCDSLTSLNLSGGYGHKVLSHVIQALCSVSALQNADTTNTNTNNTSNLMVGSPLVGNLPPPSASPVGNASGSGINTSVSVSAAAAAVAAASASVSSTINISLRSLDVSKNDLGDAGAIALAELIRTNNKSLMRIACDKNGFSFAGFLSIVSALDKNETLLMLEANENLAQIIQSLIGTPVMSRMNSITGTLSTLLERNISKTPAENIPRFISKILQDYSCPWVSLFNSSSVGDLSPLKPAPDAPPKIVEVKSGVQTPQQQQQQQQQQPRKK